MADRTFDSQVWAQDQRMRGIEAETAGTNLGIQAVDSAFARSHQEAIEERRQAREFALKQQDLQIQQQTAEVAMQERQLNMQEQQRRLQMLGQVSVAKAAKLELDLKEEAVKAARLSNEHMAAQTQNMETPQERERDFALRARSHFDSDQAILNGIYVDPSTGRLGPPPPEEVAKARERKKQSDLIEAMGHDPLRWAAAGYAMNDDGNLVKDEAAAKKVLENAPLLHAFSPASQDRADLEALDMARVIHETRIKKANAILIDKSKSLQERAEAKRTIDKEQAIVDDITRKLDTKVSGLNGGAAGAGGASAEDLEARIARLLGQ